MRIPLPPLLALAACSNQPANEVAPVDIGNAAGTAQGAIDNYAAFSDEPPAPVSTPVAKPTPTSSTAPNPTPSLSNMISEEPLTPYNAQDVGNVMQTSDEGRSDLSRKQ